MRYQTIEQRLDECQERIGYWFKKPELLRTALTHSTCAPTPSESNERMEFLGDAFLGLVIAELLYRRFPDELEGTLSIFKGAVVSRRSCVRVAKRLDLDRYLLVGKGMEPIPDSLLANVVESLIASVYLDGGGRAAIRFVRKIFAEEVEAELDQRNETNFKATLQSNLHHHGFTGNPDYVLLDEKGPDHDKCFKIQVQVGGRCFQAAWGNTKKIAEQKAAENALCALEKQSVPWPDGE